MATNFLLHEKAVLAALEAMRTGRALGNHPLRYFQSVQVHLGTPHLLAGDAAIQYAIYRHLTQVITGHLAQLRQILDLPSPECSHFSPDEDFQYDNAELEAWSVLYHRYVCINHDISPDDLADRVSVNERTIRRRQQLGITRLTFVLVDRERDFRQQRKREHLLLALPTRHPPRLFGKESILSTSCHLLAEADPPRHVVLHGPSGIGKSTLARHLAYDLVTRECFDDFLWLEIDDLALSEIIERLGLSSGGDTLASVDALRAYLFDHNVLIMLDGAERLVAHPHCAEFLAALNMASVVLTSQRAPSPDLWCYTLELSELTREQAMDYLDYIARQLPARFRAHWIDRFDDLWAAVGGNPRALRWVLHASCSLPLDAAIASHNDLNAFITRLWNQISSAERRVMLLPLLCINDYDQMCALSGLETRKLNRAIESLVNQAVLSPHHEAGKTRYTLPSVNLTALIDQVRRGLAITSQQLALDFIRDVLARIVSQLQSQLEPNAKAEIGAQALCALELAREFDFTPEEQCQYTHQLAALITSGVCWSSWAKQLTRLLDMALAPHHAAWVHFTLGVALRWLGQFDTARGHLDQAQAYYADDPVARADVLIELAVIHRYQLRWDQARGLAQAALDSYQQADHASGIARSLHEMAQLCLEEHNPSEALSWLDRLGDWTPRTLGIASQAHLLLEQHDLALESAERALAALPITHPNCGRAASTLGQIYYELGDTGAAIASLTSATLLLDETKDLLGYGRACNNLAVAHLEDVQAHIETGIEEEHTRRAREIRDLLSRARGIQAHVGDEMGLLVTDQNLAWFDNHFPDL